MKISFKYSFKQFNKYFQKNFKSLEIKLIRALSETATVYAEQAVMYTPPSVGSQVIEQKKYYRPILNLVKLVNKEYGSIRPTQQDILNLRRGMFFKVLNTRTKPPTTLGYTHNLIQAKKMARIKNRGLAKAMWGKNLTNIGASVPTSIQSLIAKSPNIATKNLNNVSIKKNKNKMSLTISNNVNYINRIGMQAASIAEKIASNFLNNKIKLLLNQIFR